MKLILTSCLFLLLMIIIAFLPINVHASGIWITDDYGDYSDYRLIHSFYSQSSNFDSYARVDASDPALIKIKALSDLTHISRTSQFIYDLGYGIGTDRLGYSSVQGFSTYRILIKWQFNGYYTDNPLSYFQITYSSYYLDNSGTPITLTSYTYDFSSKTWQNELLIHTLTGYNAISGEELYLKIQFVIHSLVDSPGLFGGDFANNGYFIQLLSVEYQHYEPLTGDINP